MNRDFVDVLKEVREREKSLFADDRDRLSNNS